MIRDSAKLCDLVRLGAALSGVAVLAVASPSAAQFVVTDLHPSGSLSSLAAGIGDGQQVGYGNDPSSGLPHALLWTGSPDSVVDLNPSGFDSSEATGASGGQQVGFAPTRGYLRAMLWTGTPASAVDLTPAGFLTSIAYGVGDGRQVGSYQPGGAEHAVLWAGTPESAIDLHPAQLHFPWSRAMGVGDGQQVGFVMNPRTLHALLWTGAPESAVDLNPAGFSTSAAYGVSGGQQVGSGLTGASEHALLWTGTAESVVDLHPAGYRHSRALGVAGCQQVGLAVDPATGADRWPSVAPGTAHGNMAIANGLIFVNVGSGLRILNEANGSTLSVATGIDADGNIVGWACCDGAGGGHAMLWTPSIAADDTGGGDTRTGHTGGHRHRPHRMTSTSLMQ